jgi:uncharacterized membrane protein YeaQ/YmgE (transglycosylase-associated protein family)
MALIVSAVNELKTKAKQIMQAIGVLAWLILGGIAGWLAGLAMKSRGGILTNIVVGIIGAFMGGLLFSVLGFAGPTGFNIWSLLVAFVGAVLLLGGIRILNVRRRRQIFN